MVVVEEVEVFVVGLVLVVGECWFVGCVFVVYCFEVVEGGEGYVGLEVLQVEVVFCRVRVVGIGQVYFVLVVDVV